MATHEITALNVNWDESGRTEANQCQDSKKVLSKIGTEQDSSSPHQKLRRFFWKTWFPQRLVSSEAIAKTEPLNVDRPTLKKSCRVLTQTVLFFFGELINWGHTEPQQMRMQTTCSEGLLCNSGNKIPCYLVLTNGGHSSLWFRLKLSCMFT